MAATSKMISAPKVILADRYSTALDPDMYIMLTN